MERLQKNFLSAGSAQLEGGDKRKCLGEREGAQFSPLISDPGPAPCHNEYTWHHCGLFNSFVYLANFQDAKRQGFIRTQKVEIRRPIELPCENRVIRIRIREMKMRPSV